MPSASTSVKSLFCLQLTQQFETPYLLIYRRFQKKACEKGRSKEIVVNKHPYHVDGEVGRFAFITHSVGLEDDMRYNTGWDVFPRLKGKEFYRTTGFKEIAMIYGDTEESFRKTAKLTWIPT